MRLVMGPAQDLRSLRAQHAELARLLAAWRDEEAFAGATLVAEKLLFGTLGFAEAEIGTLQAALGKLQRDLRAYWSAVKTLAAHQQTAGAAAAGDAVTGEPGDRGRSWAALCADLALAQELHGIEAWFAENAASLAVDFGPWAAGVATDWAAVFAALDWAATFVGLYPDAQAPAPLAYAVSREGDASLDHFAGLVAAVKAGLDGVAGELAFATTVLPVAALCAPGATQAETEIAAMGERVAFLLEHLPCLERWLDCQRQLQRCIDLGLGGLIEAALGERPFPPDLVAIFEKRLYQSWLDAAVRQMPALAAFRGATHEQTIARFRLRASARSICTTSCWRAAGCAACSPSSGVARCSTRAPAATRGLPPPTRSCGVRRRRSATARSVPSYSPARPRCCGSSPAG